MIARFNDHNVNIERSYLQPQRLTQAFESKFGCAIEALIGNRDEAADRSDIDDVPRPLQSHDRQRCPAHPENTEEVHFKLRNCLLDRRLLDCSCCAAPRIVDQDIQPPLSRHYRFDRLRDGRVIRDVQHQR